MMRVSFIFLGVFLIFQIEQVSTGTISRTTSKIIVEDDSVANEIDNNLEEIGFSSEDSDEAKTKTNTLYEDQSDENDQSQQETDDVADVFPRANDVEESDSHSVEHSDSDEDDIYPRFANLKKNDRRKTLQYSDEY